MGNQANKVASAATSRAGTIRRDYGHGGSGRGRSGGRLLDRVREAVQDPADVLRQEVFYVECAGVTKEQ